MTIKARAGKPDPRVTKRRVTMTGFAVSHQTDDQGNTSTIVQELRAIDFVRSDILDAYVTDARRRWTDVEVSEEPDAGPAGYDGPTFVPFGTAVPKVDSDGRPTGEHEWHEFPHELAGSYFPAADCKNCSHAPEHPLEPGRKARLIRAEEG